MSGHLVEIRELIGWGFDSYEYRPVAPLQKQTLKAVTALSQRASFEQSNALLADQTEHLREMFEPYLQRPDLLTEMAGLEWSLGVIDLRCLIAFQRRLAFSEAIAQPSPPQANNWPALLAFSFGPAKPVQYETFHDSLSQTILLKSSNPNLHLRINNDSTSLLSVHAGGPFFEVCRFRNRWFLRDGYHRAYALLKAGVIEVPAVIIEADTIEELGANRPWFFSEDVLFSQTPPRMVDFLNDDLVREYTRPALIKTLRIQMEDTLTPVTFTTGEQP